MPHSASIISGTPTATVVPPHATALFGGSQLEAPPARATVLERHNVRVIGSGKPTLLFCNGFGCTQHIWRYLTGPLALEYQLVLFDYAGMGESVRSDYDPQRYNTIAGHAQDIVEICQALALREVVLVGHSVGASIAMQAALRAPQYFKQAIMLAPSPCYVNKPDYYGGTTPEEMVQLLSLMDASYDDWANLFAGLLVGPDRPASLGEELVGYFCTMDSEIAKHFAHVVFQADNRADLARFQLPTLLLQCAQDAVAPEEVGDYMAAHLPHATLKQLHATGHCPHLSAPLETLEAIREYLAS